MDYACFATEIVLEFVELSNIYLIILTKYCKIPVNTAIPGNYQKYFWK